MSEHESRALEASHLRTLPPEILAAVMARATRIHVAAGSTLHHEGDTSPHVRLVVSGLVRVCVGAGDGRTMTVRYCRVGALLGVMSLFASPFRLPASIQAVTDAELLGLPPALLERASQQDGRVARALLTELSERVVAFVEEIPGAAFATVRQRVARHLLDLASEDQRSPELVVTITQQELADAVGTVREVVVRTLREMRREGVLDTARDRIVLLEPERLAVEWNKSS